MNMSSPLLFALLIVCFLPLMSATVVLDFNHVERCKDSLYMGTPPRGISDIRLKKICQRYADKPRFVTLYDPQKRIPVYSAYTFKKTEGDRRVDYPWMYEPQLAEIDGNGNMLPFPTGYLHMKFEDSQAVLDDYSDVVLYERGHLNPDQHQSTPHDRAATYTLTNVVPEIREFNIGPWREYEERIRVRLNNFCRGHLLMTHPCRPCASRLHSETIIHHCCISSAFLQLLASHMGAQLCLSPSTCAALSDSFLVPDLVLTSTGLLNCHS
uniref:DNA/RNA non-specific endonuclease domain-containing protein n=1 Tax=Seriola dumerili TaxID=41447 RepID=A0A3B4USY9_SERDU